ncbi:MAG: YitT family protein [Oscillospiraceae bacterium]
MKEKIKDFVVMTLGTLIAGVGIYFFKFPNNFSTGGVSGLAIILAKIIPNISIGQMVLMINIALLIIGFIFLGKSFGGKTVYCSLLLSFSLTILEKIVPIAAPLTNQPLMELIFAVLLTSIGSAFLFYSNASSGGTDIIAMILKKYSTMDIGKALLASDAIIATMSIFVFGIQTGLFSILGLVSKSFVVNIVMSSLTLSKNCIVIVNKEYSNEICEFITKVLHRGATILDCKGYYTDEEKTGIITVIKKSQIPALRTELRNIDKKAFLVVTNTNEAYGRGFNII